MSPAPVVHIELHTASLCAASAFYSELCGWSPQRVDMAGGVYHALSLGRGLCGGIVECGSERAIWLPYVEVDRIERATDHARVLGASVLLEPREGPAGWRGVVAAPAAGELALWQPKRAR